MPTRVQTGRTLPTGHLLFNFNICYGSMTVLMWGHTLLKRCQSSTLTSPRTVWKSEWSLQCVHRLKLCISKEADSRSRVKTSIMHFYFKHVKGPGGRAIRVFMYLSAHTPHAGSNLSWILHFNTRVTQKTIYRVWSTSVEGSWTSSRFTSHPQGFFRLQEAKRRFFRLDHHDLHYWEPTHLSILDCFYYSFYYTAVSLDVVNRGAFIFQAAG